MPRGRGEKSVTVARLLVTGSRYFNNAGLMHAAISDAVSTLRGFGFARIVLVHGGARGADTLAARIGRSMGLEIEAHPARWDVFGRAAGPVRNREMVELGADLVLAFPVGESQGTRGCMQIAQEKGCAVINVTEGCSDALGFLIVF